MQHKGKLKKCLDKDPIQSIRKLISKFQDSYPDKVVPGYVRHFSIESLVIGIWSRVDAEEFDELKKDEEAYMGTTIYQSPYLLCVIFQGLL